MQELESRNWLSVMRVKGGDPAAARGFVTNAFRINFDRLAEAPPVHDDTLPRGASSDTPPGAPNSTTPVHGEALPPVHDGAPKSGKDTGKGNREESPPTPSRFDQWWEAYPLKVGKEDAQRLFLRAIGDRKATADELLAGAQRYAEAVTDRDPKFIKQPVNWLRGRHWADESAPSNPSRGVVASATGSGRPSAMAYLGARRARRLGHE